MIDDELVLRVERLRDSLDEFQLELRKRYRRKSMIVGAATFRKEAAGLGEVWLVEIASRPDVKHVLGDEIVGDLNIDFQRLLTFSEHGTRRQKYDKALASILTDFRANLIVPLKQSRNRPIPAAVASPATADTVPKSVFIGQSFADRDKELNDHVRRCLEAFGLSVLTGEEPSAESVSAKIKSRIEQADLFVGIFTRRDKLAGKNEWNTSAWIVDEKAYALAKGKRLILLKEEGVGSVGGLQGDYEYHEFRRARFDRLLIRLMEVMHGLQHT